MNLKKTIFLTLTWLALGLCGGVLAVLLGTHLYLSPSLPSVESLREIRLQTPLRIYSVDGKLIGEIGEQRRTPVKYQEIPQGYIDALLSAEDAQFYTHSGVSITGLLRATSQLLTSGDIQGGGSTITMQVARNFFLSKRQEFMRKFNEILLALRIERELTKNEILELYVNVIFLGHRAYGIEAAANVYYGKSLHELSPAQLAMLAGVPKAPSTMNPITNPERAVQRRNWILGRMLALGKLDQNSYRLAINEPVSARYHGSRIELNAAYAAEMARQKAVELFGRGAYTDGYRVYTTVDSNLQESAQRAVIEGLLAYDRRHGYRGPEKKLPVPEVIAAGGMNSRTDPAADTDTEDQPATSTDADASTTRIITPDPGREVVKDWYTKLQAALSDIPTYGGLVPAAIVSIGEKSAVAMRADGSKITIDWEAGLEAARPYLTVNSLGPKPKSASDVVSLGDVVRLRQDATDTWQLYQLPQAQSALVSLNPTNGAILAMVGGLDFYQSNFNRVTQARRQPGSSFKPFIYTAALENGYTAASIINDAPIVFEDDMLESDWRPVNDSGKFYGPTRLRKALYLSRNLVSIRLLKSVGINRTLRKLEEFGFDTSTMPRDLSLALGSHSMPPLQIAAGFSVFANGGYRVEPYYIERILDFDGKPVFESLPLTACFGCEDPSNMPGEEADDMGWLDPDWKPNAPFDFEGDPFELSREVKALTGTLEPEDYPRADKVVDSQTVYIVDSMLRDAVTRGTATRARVLERNDLAGKTGTTNNATDAWFSGYGGGIVTTAWMGFDNAETLGRREYGGTSALPVWIDFMRDALKNRPEKRLPQPPGLVTVRINPDTGLRARTDDRDAIFEIFREDEVPPMDSGAPISPSLWDNVDDSFSTDELF